MVKHYVLLTNKQRLELCRLIHHEGLTIKEAARVSGIPYPNAKAVNKIYEREQRTNKKHHKFLIPREKDERFDDMLDSGGGKEETEKLWKENQNGRSINIGD
jgi:hypothetical protein